MPVSSYAPELMELFKRGARDTITIPCEDKKDAIRLRFQMHNLRAAMRRENHALTTLVNGTQISVTEDGRLMIYPSDSKFLAALHNAGIIVGESDKRDNDQSQLPTTAPLPPTDAKDTEEALADFYKGRKK